MHARVHYAYSTYLEHGSDLVPSLHVVISPPRSNTSSNDSGPNTPISHRGEDRRAQGRLRIRKRVCLDSYTNEGARFPSHDYAAGMTDAATNGVERFSPKDLVCLRGGPQLSSYTIDIVLLCNPNQDIRLVIEVCLEIRAQGRLLCEGDFG